MRPGQTFFEITRNCPLNCSMCLLKTELKKKGKELAALDIAEIIISAGNRQVTLTGGEPFFRKDIDQIISRLSNANHSISVLTSGISNNALDINKLKTVLKKHSICVSIDGDYELHDEIRGRKNCLRDSLLFINNFVNKMNVGVQTVVQRDNINELKDIVDICARNDIHRLTLNFERYNTPAEYESLCRLIKAYSPAVNPERDLSCYITENFNVDSDYIKGKIFETIRYGLKLGVLVFPFPYKWALHPELYYEREFIGKNCLLLKNNSAYFDADGKRIICTNIRIKRDSEVGKKICTDISSGKLLPVCKRCCNCI